MTIRPAPPPATLGVDGNGVGTGGDAIPTASEGEEVVITALPAFAVTAGGVCVAADTKGDNGTKDDDDESNEGGEKRDETLA